MILTTLYDNVSLNPQFSLKEDWGFSLFVQEDGHSILFEKVRYIAPSHCTGDTAKKIFKDVFKERFIQNGVGRTIKIEDERLGIE